MKKSRKLLLKIIIMLLIITTIFSFVSFVRADEEVSEDTPVETKIEPRTISEDETTDESEFDDQVAVISLDEEEISETIEESESSVFICKNSVTIDSPIYGNAFIIANDVTVNNAINGTVFILANNVTFTEYSEANVLFVTANNVTIEGYVRDLFCSSNKLTISEASYIERDLYCSSKNVNILGFISRNAYISCSNLEIPGEALTINGNLYYSANKENISDSLVSGKIEFTKASFFSASNLKDLLFNLLNIIIYSLIITLIIMLVFKKFSSSLFESLVLDFKKIILWGIAGFIIIPIISFLLIVSVVGSLLGILLLSAYLVILAISFAMTGFALGNLICHKLTKTPTEKSPIKLLIISILTTTIISLLSKIPYVGPIILIASLILGLGIIAYYIKNNKTILK